MKRWFVPRDVQPFLDAVALASVTRRLWWEQNLVFSSGGLLRHRFGDHDIDRWLVDKLGVIEPQVVVVCTWDGADLEVAEGALPSGLQIGDRVPATLLAAGVLDDGEPIAFSALYARLDGLADAVETPARLLQLVNGQLTQGEFNWYTMATAVIAFADPNTGRFAIATAAHPRAFVRKTEAAGG